MAFNYASDMELVSRYPVYTCDNSGKQMSALWTLREMQKRHYTPAEGMDSMPLPANDVLTFYEQGIAEFLAGKRALTPENWNAFVAQFDKLGGAAWEKEGIEYAKANNYLY